MPIEHFGIGVPDVGEAKAYYDELLPLFGYMPFFRTGYVPTDWNGAQLFLYPALEAGDYSRHRVGLQHIAFMVNSPADVRRVHEWAVDRGHEILHEPKLFPEYGEHHLATFFLDKYGFMIEAVCFTPEEAD